MDALATALRALPSPATTLEAWWTATAAARAAHATTVDRAIAGGAFADRVAFAFAAGYAEALRALVPAHADELSALCATEDGGNHPRAIQTRLVPDGSRFRVTGRKRWATWAGEVRTLLVVASVGTDEHGHNRLRVVRVPATADGVRVTATAAPFVPELPHASIELDDVVVDAAAVLPGDGYDRYLKPFRTIEDIHVHAALVGYLLGVVRRYELGRPLLEQLAATAMTLRQLASCEPLAPTTHVALAGAIDVATAQVAAIERAWSATPEPGDEHARWQRDRALLGVAGKARAARRERAWELLATPDFDFDALGVGWG